MILIIMEKGNLGMSLVQYVRLRNCEVISLL